jgi:hypothetical protein
MENISRNVGTFLQITPRHNPKELQHQERKGLPLTGFELSLDMHHLTTCISNTNYASGI